MASSLSSVQALGYGEAAPHTETDGAGSSFVQVGLLRQDAQSRLEVGDAEAVGEPRSIPPIKRAIRTARLRFAKRPTAKAA